MSSEPRDMSSTKPPAALKTLEDSSAETRPIQFLFQMCVQELIAASKRMNGSDATQLADIARQIDDNFFRLQIWGSDLGVGSENPLSFSDILALEDSALSGKVKSLLEGFHESFEIIRQNLLPLSELSNEVEAGKNGDESPLEDNISDIRKAANSISELIQGLVMLSDPIRMEQALRMDAGPYRGIQERIRYAAKTLGERQIRKTTDRDEQASLDPPAEAAPSNEALQSSIESILDLGAPDPWEGQHLLTFDGGGTRTYSGLLILGELMRIIRDKEQDRASQSRPPTIPMSDSPNQAENQHTGIDRSIDLDYLPCQYFDYIAGAGSGGILAIMLGRFRMRIDECIEELVEMGNNVFGKPRWFSVRGPLFFPRDQFDSGKLEDAMKNIVKRRSKEVPGYLADLFASPSDMCKTMVLVSRKGRVDEPIFHKTWIFRSYDHYAREEPPNMFERNPGPASSTKIWNVALATSSAPTYLKRAKIGVDKFFALTSSNPTVQAMYEVAQCHRIPTLDSIALVLSIGSGKVRRPSRFTARVFGEYFASLKAAQQLAADSFTVDDAKRLQRGSKFAYTRLSVSHGLEDMSLYEWKTRSRLRKRTQTTLEHITKETMEYLRQEEVQKELRKMAEMLVENRRKRSTTPRWEAFSGSALISKQEE